MKYYFCGAFTAVLLVLTSQESAALSKKQEAAQNKCITAYNKCAANKCGTLSNSNAVDECLKKCARTFQRCQKKALEAAPFQSNPGESNSDVPVLSTE